MYPLTVLWPGLIVTCVVVALNLFGDALREAADPVANPALRQVRVRRAEASHAQPGLTEPEPIGRDCPECGKPLVKKRGRFGEFIACTGYPECRHTEPIVHSTGIACPKCGASDGGEVVRRKSRKGRAFFGCSRYPECDYVSWTAPEKPKCPRCGAVMDGNACVDCGYVEENGAVGDA